MASSVAVCFLQSRTIGDEPFPGDFLYFPGGHVYNQSPCSFGAFQILTNLSSVVLTRLGCRCHIAFPVEDDFRPTIRPLSERVDDACYGPPVIVPSRPQIEYSQLRSQQGTIFGYD